MKKINVRLAGRAVKMAVVFTAMLGFAACTFLNEASFSIDSPASNEALLNNIENYFTEIGLKLERKIDFTYPEKRKEISYFLGRTQGPVPLHSTYSYVVLRLEESGVLYIDWIKISDTKQVPKPEYFQAAHERITKDLKTRFGVDVKFIFVEPK